MYLPWRKKEWSDAEYEDICGRYEAKHQCMIANSVKIIRKAEYAEYMDYVERKYGKGFLDSCRVNKFVPSDQ